jgi:hypothetical protein
MERDTMTILNRAFIFFFLASVTSSAAMARDDYPTVAVVDYVYGCMKANGNTRDSLEKCSCSVDVIGTIIPYSDYESAETFKSLSLMTGERGSLFRQAAPAKNAAAMLKRAQAEAEVRCF